MRPIQLLDDIIGLFFPVVCAVCREKLSPSEQILCLGCLVDLPYTTFHSDPENPMARQLWGRFRFSSAFALCYFKKGTAVQSLVHQLKYKNKPVIGTYLGRIYGRRIRSQEHYFPPDLIIPVPLHPSKQKKRGYNQSEQFAIGLSEVLNVPVDTRNLRRTRSTETQTRKSRFMRFTNMKDIFQSVNPAVYAGKHIYLADDVMTTGSTAEACALELLRSPGCRVTVVTIAFSE